MIAPSPRTLAGCYDRPRIGFLGSLRIGRNIGTAVSHDYEASFAFPGKLGNVTVELK